MRPSDGLPRRRNPEGERKATRGPTKGVVSSRKARLASAAAAQAISRALEESKATPLQVMLDVLDEHWNEAQATPTGRSRHRRQMGCVAIAEKVAPYIHPRLSATKVSGDPKNPLEMVVGMFSAADLYKRVRGVEEVPGLEHLPERQTVTIDQPQEQRA